MSDDLFTFFTDTEASSWQFWQFWSVLIAWRRPMVVIYSNCFDIWSFWTYNELKANSLQYFISIVLLYKARCLSTVTIRATTKRTGPCFVPFTPQSLREDRWQKGTVSRNHSCINDLAASSVLPCQYPYGILLRGRVIKESSVGKSLVTKSCRSLQNNLSLDSSQPGPYRGSRLIHWRVHKLLVASTAFHRGLQMRTTSSFCT